MKKIILSVLVLSVLIVSLGVVSADFGVEFVTPEENEYILGDNYLIKWENTGTPGLYLQYKEGDCGSGDWATLLGPFDESVLTYSWDTSSYDDGEYCLRLYMNSLEYAISEPFTIDNTEPVITTFSVIVPGDEDSVYTEIFVLASDTNLASCKIAWGDGNIDSCIGNPLDYSHQYGDNGPYTVILTVKDEAGHEVSDTIIANPANIDPIVSDEIGALNNNDEDLDGLVEVAVGEAVFFEAEGSDVDEDLEAGLTFTWTFDKGTAYEEVVVTTADSGGYSEVYYTWTSASEHTVDLTISDKDGGSIDAVQFELEVEEPEHMTPMQQVIAGSEFEFEFDENWAVSGEPKQFQTSISGLTDCELITSVNGMDVTPDDDRCEVDWNPDNNQRGKHSVIIKVTNDANEFKYYSFDVTVYSWGIELEKGWNLISIPYMPTNSDIDDVFANIIDNIAYEDTSTATVFQYNAVERVWYRARTTSTHSGFDYVTGQSNVELTSIVPGYAYWIKMENEAILYGAEENFPVNTVPGANGIDLATESWNLVGRFGIDSASSFWKTAFKYLRQPFYNKHYVSSLLGIYSLKSVTANGDTTWEPVTDNEEGNIKIAQGYWVRTAEGENGRTTIRYEPDII